MPSAAAGTATTAASTACCAAIRPGPKPSARCTPKPVRRRWTSACAPAASIVPAATSATSENATSSEITIPAACESRICTPVRVMNCSLPSPKATARAWVSVTSAFDGSLSHSSAMFGRTRRSSPIALTNSCSLTYTRAALASGKATLSGETAMPTTRSGPR